MQERSQVSSDHSVRALNQIDVVSNDSREVREAWSELYQAFFIKPLPQHVVDERLRRLLSAIAKDIGLNDALRNDDLGRVYTPVVQAQERFIRDMQREQLIASFQGNNAASAATGPNPDGLWPPKPDSTT